MEHMENVCIQSVWDYGGNLAKETPALKDSQWLRAANGWMRTKLCSRGPKRSSICKMFLAATVSMQYQDVFGCVGVCVFVCV